MKGKTPNKAELEWMGAIREIGCIVCRDHYYQHTPAAVHHIDGKTKPGAHLLTIPLCSRHHQYRDNHKPPRWISRHGDGRKAFEREYGTEMAMLDRCKELIDG
jgi:hypothetical protein